MTVVVLVLVVDVVVVGKYVIVVVVVVSSIETSEAVLCAIVSTLATVEFDMSPKTELGFHSAAIFANGFVVGGGVQPRCLYKISSIFFSFCSFL